MTRTPHTPALDEHALRVDLAAAFRLAAQFNWHESVGNHFSAAVSDDGKTFLLNPRAKPWLKLSRRSTTSNEQPRRRSSPTALASR